MRQRLDEYLARVFAAADVDYGQWRALTRVLLRADLRTTRASNTQFGAGSSSSQSPQLIGQILTYLIMGAITSILVFMLDDLMLSATIMLTYVMFMVGLMVLVDHQSVITSPDDYLVLGPRPVSSRTYFAVRLTNVLVYAWAVTSLYGIAPILALGLAHGFHLIRAVAAIPAFYLATTFVTLALVLSYASLVRFVGASRLTRVMSYAQLIVGVLVNGASLLSGQLLRVGQMNMAMPQSPWMLLFPPTWFASYVAIAEGSIGLRQVLPAAASIVALFVLARGLGGRLSLDYASKLGAIVSATAAPAAVSQRQPWFFRNGEHRVMSLLIRAQFRHDPKFRMAVMGALPITIMYMFLMFQNGAPTDPFDSTPWEMISWMPLTLTVLFFPVMLRMALLTSDAYRAAWIYFGTPVSRARILRAQTDVLMVGFVVPYVLLVGVLMSYVSGHPAGVFLHVVFLGLGSRLLLQVITAAAPILPFSRPAQKMGRQPRILLWLFVTMIGGFLLSPLLVFLVYVSALRIIVTLLALIALSAALDRLTRARLGEKAQQLQFEGGVSAG